MLNTMKTLQQILILIFFSTQNLIGQTKLPKNLEQSVLYLDKDCSNIVKSKIKTINDDSLKYAIYPFAYEEPFKSYKTIFNWTSDENGNPKLVRYLEEKGVYNNHSEILLYSFKQYLNYGKINESNILHKYIEIEKKLDDEDKIKFTTDTIDRIYIPKNLEECFVQINSFWNDSIKSQVKSWEENEFTANAHFGFGMWMRNNWRLWGGSRLSKYFNELEIFHPDDMSGIILVSYHRFLNNKEIRLEEQIKYYKDYWEKSKKEELKRKQEEFSEFKIGTKLEFHYEIGFVSKEQETKYDNDTCIAKGIVIERNEKDFLIKVKVIETCDKKGIVYYDNNGSIIYNPKTKRWSNPPKRIIKKVKKNKEQWFEYKDWEILE